MMPILNIAWFLLFVLAFVNAIETSSEPGWQAFCVCVTVLLIIVNPWS